MSERIPVDITTTENPWQKTSWECIYPRWSIRRLQKEYIRLSEELANQYADADDVKCVGYLLNIWGDKTDEETIRNHVMMLKDSQVRWIGKQILHPYLLENECL